MQGYKRALLYLSLAIIAIIPYSILAQYLSSLEIERNQLLYGKHFMNCGPPVFLVAFFLVMIVGGIFLFWLLIICKMYESPTKSFQIQFDTIFVFLGLITLLVYMGLTYGIVQMASVLIKPIDEKAFEYVIVSDTTYNAQAEKTVHRYLWLKNLPQGPHIGGFERYIDYYADGTLKKDIMYDGNNTHIGFELYYYPNGYVKAIIDHRKNIQCLWYNSGKPCIRIRTLPAQANKEVTEAWSATGKSYFVLESGQLINYWDTLSGKQLVKNGNGTLLIPGEEAGTAEIYTYKRRLLQRYTLYDVNGEKVKRTVDTTWGYRTYYYSDSKRDMVIEVQKTTAQRSLELPETLKKTMLSRIGL